MHPAADGELLTQDTSSTWSREYTPSGEYSQRREPLGYFPA
jgi:hypothetical protein